MKKVIFSLAVLFGLFLFNPATASAQSDRTGRPSIKSGELCKNKAKKNKVSKGKSFSHKSKATKRRRK